MVYVYAITNAPHAGVPEHLGLDDQPLATVARGSVAAVYSQHPGGTIRPTAERVWRHEQVVERLMRDDAVLPARFGTLLRDEEALADTLTEHEGALAASLDRVRGCVELGLRVLWQAPADEKSRPSSRNTESGRAYMLARCEEERREREQREAAEHLAGQLHAPLAALAEGSAHRVLATPELLLSAAYLVPGDRSEAFRQAVERLGATRPDLRLLCTGPWPPYHFVPALPAAAEASRV